MKPPPERQVPVSRITGQVPHSAQRMVQAATVSTQSLFGMDQTGRRSALVVRIVSDGPSTQLCAAATICPRYD